MSDFEQRVVEMLSRLEREIALPLGNLAFDTLGAKSVDEKMVLAELACRVTAMGLALGGAVLNAEGLERMLRHAQKIAADTESPTSAARVLN